MFRVFVILSFLTLGHQPVLAQSAALDEQSLAEGSMLQEQAAICAAFARVMEYSGLLEEKSGVLWRERRFYAGALLRKTVTDSTGQEPSNGMIDGIIGQYSNWMIGLFSTSTGSGDSNDLNDRDKLKDYVTTFCTPLFTNADRAIARVRPELFELPSPQQQQPVGPVVAEQPAQQPEITEPAEPAASFHT